jgi:hypothetical protein
LKEVRQQYPIVIIPRRGRASLCERQYTGPRP